MPKAAKALSDAAQMSAVGPKADLAARVSIQAFFAFLKDKGRISI
jgi:hypothetical protein